MKATTQNVNRDRRRPMSTTVALKRGLRFRHVHSTATRRVEGVELATEWCIITAVRWNDATHTGGRVYWRWDFGEPGIGRARWHSTIEPDSRFPELRPGFEADIVAEWAD